MIATDARNYRKTTGPEFGIMIGAVILVLSIYLYPSLRARAEFGPTVIPQIFAPDLTLYLNLSNVKMLNQNEVTNPYYRIPVPSRATSYLKFRLGAILFSELNGLLGGRTWTTMLIWNAFWWGALALVTLKLFARFLHNSRPLIVVAGLLLLMLFNFGVARTLLEAWVHFPSLTAFQQVGLPYMRSFNPQVPIVLLLAYLGLQIEVLRRRRSLFLYAAMAVLQLVSLAIFPYAALVMVGLTSVSVLWQVISRVQSASWIAFGYGCVCGTLDILFLQHGSLTFYGERSSAYHFQPQLITHLLGATWFVLLGLTVVAILNKTLSPEVKWPLVGAALTTLVLMLGDAFVPATTLLLSIHAGYFVHPMIAVFITFLVSAAFGSVGDGSTKVRLCTVASIIFVVLTGLFLSLGTYRVYRSINQEQVEVTRLVTSLNLQASDMIIARSRFVDDSCGWVALASQSQVMFCTDAEMMLTPQQSREVHRFRQALYLYLAGKDIRYLRGVIADHSPKEQMYELGYWAEAVSLSPQEQQEGLDAISAELIPRLERIQQHDDVAIGFCRKFRKIVIIDNSADPTFVRTRLASFVTIQTEQHVGKLVALVSTPN
jgi:hypothetical protein